MSSVVNSIDVNRTFCKFFEHIFNFGRFICFLCKRKSKDLNEMKRLDMEDIFSEANFLARETSHRPVNDAILSS